MAGRRRFDIPDRTKDEGPIFDLYDQEFHCIADVPGAAIDRLVSSWRTLDDGRRVLDQYNGLRFLRSCVREQVWVPAPETWNPDDGPAPDAHWEPADDLDRFNAIVESKTQVVPFQTLVEIIAWLEQEYTARPPT